MAVPTMYNYLLSHYEQHLSAQEQAAAQQAAAGLRLTVSGSAAAPVPLLRRWQQLSGQVLLERYGMTETGMILSNPYQVGGWLQCAWLGEEKGTHKRHKGRASGSKSGSWFVSKHNVSTVNRQGGRGQRQ